MGIPRSVNRELHAAWLCLESWNMSAITFTLLGIPFACNARTGAMAAAPAALRRASLSKSFAALGGIDRGDAIPLSVTGQDQDAFQTAALDITAALASLTGRFVLIGGDCTVACGALPALRARRPFLVWIDAHGDINTSATTPSGYWPGMPVAYVAGLETPIGPSPAPLPGRDIVIVGARDLDPGEAENAGSIGATILMGPPPPLSQLPARAPGQSVFIHLDLDVLDPAVLPAVNFRTPGGWSEDELVTWLTELGKHDDVMGMEVTGFDPTRDPDGRVARGLVKLLVRIVTAIWGGEEPR